MQADQEKPVLHRDEKSFFFNRTGSNLTADLKIWKPGAVNGSVVQLFILIQIQIKDQVQVASFGSTQKIKFQLKFSTFPCGTGICLIIVR